MKHIITIFLIALGMMFLCKSCCHAAAIPAEYEYLLAKRTKYIDLHPKAPSREQKAKWQEEYEFHLFNAKRTYEDAKTKAWYMPNLSDREKAKYCFTSAIATMGSATLTTKLVVAVASLLAQYGLDCQDEYEYITTKLYWSQYHLEMCEHFQSLIRG